MLSSNTVLLNGNEARPVTASSCPDKDRWYVVQTHPRKEAYAAMNLERQKFQSFWPRFRKSVSHARSRREVLAPLFPGYVFVKFDPSTDPWHSVNSTFGVTRLISARGQIPVPVPRSVMDHFLDRCREGILETLVPQMVPGQAVRIISGPFAERLAKIAHCDDRGRVAILLEIMGQDQVFAVHSSTLVPA